ncbi:MAG: hypothetical protein R2708_12600 [Vicinamibacterales bacterium]
MASRTTSSRSGDEHGWHVERLPPDGGHFVPQPLSDGAIDGRERLVEQQHARLARQRLGPGHAAVCRLELAGAPVFLALQVHLGQAGQARAPALAARPVGERRL